VPVTTIPVGWGKGEEPAVELHYREWDKDEETSTVISIADLVRGAYGTTAVPGTRNYCYDDDEDE
jgi:hypothetical protein